MRSILKIAVLLSALTLAKTTLAQSGYMGKANHVQFNLTDRAFNYSWSLTYSRCFNDWFALGLAAKQYSLNRDLYESEVYMGFNRGKSIGNVDGSGFSLGLDLTFFSNAGLSAPLGYYFSIGGEYMSSTSTETLDPEAYPFDTSDEEGVINYTSNGWHFTAGWGVQTMFAEPFTFSAGVEFGLYSQKMEGDEFSEAPEFLMPYGKTLVFSNSKTDDYKSHSVVGLSVNPVLTIGVVF